MGGGGASPFLVVMNSITDHRVTNIIARCYYTTLPYHILEQTKTLIIGKF